MVNTTSNNLSKRRRFQPPITNFFPREAITNAGSNGDHGGNSSHDNYSTPTQSPMPPLEPTIMSKLLGLGAHVRKAVSEGYKVGPLKCNEYATSHERMQVSSTGFDEMSLPESGQESNTFSIFSVISRKRSYDGTPEVSGDEEDGSSGANINQMLRRKIHSSCATKGISNTTEIWQDPVRLNGANEAFSPSSQYPRAILSPRIEQQRRLFTYSQKQTVISTGQENFNPTALADTIDMDIDDFGEAAFLRRREEVDSDYVESREVGIEMEEN